MFALVVYAIRLLPTLRNFKALAAIRIQSDPPNDTVSPGAQSVRSSLSAFECTSVRVQAAIISLHKWSRLTVLVLLAYSVTELTSLFRGISLTKMTGISALTGAWAQIFSMWTFALWFLAALCTANWFLSGCLARYDDVAARFSGRDRH